MKIRRRRQPQQPPSASEDAATVPALHRTVNRLVRLVEGRTVPSDKALDALANVTDEDIASAVTSWDDAQDDAETGLTGLLDARTGGKQES